MHPFYFWRKYHSRPFSSKRWKYAGGKLGYHNEKSYSLQTCFLLEIHVSKNIFAGEQSLTVFANVLDVLSLDVLSPRGYFMLLLFQEVEKGWKKGWRPLGALEVMPYGTCARTKHLYAFIWVVRWFYMYNVGVDQPFWPANSLGSNLRRTIH